MPAQQSSMEFQASTLMSSMTRCARTAFSTTVQFILLANVDAAAEYGECV
jgi:hypothetical protein